MFVKYYSSDFRIITKFTLGFDLDWVSDSMKNQSLFSFKKL